MSWLKKLKHYADPRTHIKAAVHLTQRAVHYADPRVHIQAAERAAHQVARTAKQAGQFTERQARKDYIKFNRITAFIAPVVTPVLAFIGELIPVFGLVIGPILAFAGAAIARVSDSVALRSQGVTGHENSQRARGKQNRTLKYGLIGSALGGIASAVGLGFTAGEAASGVPVNAANGAPTGTSAAASSAAGSTAASSSAASASSGILGTGITWSQIGSVLAPLIGVTQTVLKMLGIGQPKPAASAAQRAEYGVGAGDAGGTEGTGDVSASGPLGALGDTLAGLPLPIKLGAAALGVGVVALALSKGTK